MSGFFKFIREQGVVGLAIAFVLGAAVSKLVSSLVGDIIQPVVGMIFGSTEGLATIHYKSIMFGNFITVIIDFLIIAGVIYFVFKGLKLDKLDVKKEE